MSTQPSARQLRAWNRALARVVPRRDERPPASATYYVDSTAEFVNLVTRVYGAHISTTKYIATLTARTTRGTVRTRTWTLSPKFYSERLLTNGVSIQSEGYMEQTAVRSAPDDSDPRVVERWVEATEGPVRVDIMELNAIADSNRRARFLGQRDTRRGRPSGEFFPYFYESNNPYADCKELQAILTKIQIYPKFDPREALPDNYRTPCIINALEVLGMPSQQLADMKPLFKSGRVSCQALSQLFKRLKVRLAVTMGTDAGTFLKYYGDSNAETTYKVCLTDDHYVPIIETGLSKALLDAWVKKTPDQRAAILASAKNQQRDWNTVKLLRYLKTIPGFFKPVTPGLAQVYKHQIWKDMAKEEDFGSLEYSNSMTRPKHQRMAGKDCVRQLFAEMDPAGARAALTISYAEFNERRDKGPRHRACNEEEYQRLQEIIADNLKHGGAVCEYRYKERKTCGRITSGRMQSILTELRGLLFRNTTNIDMSNAHPRILEWICQTNGIACPQLSAFIADRDGVYAHYPSRAEAKVALLKMVNKHSLSEGTPAPLKALEDELADIRLQIIGLPQYADLRATSDETKGNLIGSWVNAAICRHEN
jgi:hypothetical protein